MGSDILSGDNDNDELEGGMDDNKGCVRMAAVGGGTVWQVFGDNAMAIRVEFGTEF